MVLLDFMQPGLATKQCPSGLALATGGYDAESRGPSAFSRVVGSIFNPFDFLHNLFGKKPNELRKLKKDAVQIDFNEVV